MWSLVNGGSRGLFSEKKKPTLCLLFCVGPQVICTTTSAVSPFLYLVACYQLYTMPMSWIGKDLAGPGFLFYWNRPLYYIISALMGFITLVSEKAKESRCSTERCSWIRHAVYKSMTLAVISNREANYLLQTGLEIFPPCDKYTAFSSRFWIQMGFVHIGSKRFRRKERVKYRAGSNTGCCLANSHIDSLHIAQSCYLHVGLDYISHS